MIKVRGMKTYPTKL